MALSFRNAPDTHLRHVVARTRGRRALFADAGARTRAAGRLADACLRHGLRCILWCVTDRCLHFVVRGSASALTLATEDVLGARVRHGHCLSTIVNADVYLLELARHAFESPVRAGLVRRAIDWPHSSARDSCGLRPPPPWLDPAPLFELLGPRDDHCTQRFRRFMDSS